jgi:hypothetical protein
VTTVRDIKDLHLDLDNDVILSSELYFWNGTERVPLLVEAIDNGTIVLVDKRIYEGAAHKASIEKSWELSGRAGLDRTVNRVPFDKHNILVGPEHKPLAQKLDERMNEHDQEAETP